MTHVVFLVRSFGFPHGLAATSRARLLGRALNEQGVAVRVLCTRPSERPPVVENRAVAGVYEGIPFEYTCGATARADRFAVRRYRELRGWAVASWRLKQLHARGELDCVYLWGGTAWALSRWALLRLLDELRVPVVLELNERPSALPGRAGPLPWRGDLLGGARGAVSISRFLTRWARAEAELRGAALAVAEIPIVVDLDEQAVTSYPNGPTNVLFAASSAYDETTRFIFEAMEHVWHTYPDCRLVITGTNSADPRARWLVDRARDGSIDERVVLTGHLPRGRLLEEYAQARALLAPLFNDVRSEARFPTKLGEYLASGRPVVSTSIGEVRRYLSDGVDAYLCPPGDSAAFGARICDVLADEQRADAVGRAGRILAREKFDYRAHGPALARLIETVVRPTAPPTDAGAALSGGRETSASARGPDRDGNRRGRRPKTGVATLKRDLWRARLWSRGTLDKLGQMESWQFLDPDASSALQRERLRALLRHAHAHVPYYRRLLSESGVVGASGDIDLEAFANIPLLDKATIRERFDELTSDDLGRRRWTYNFSGGSSGEPVRLIQDEDYVSWAAAAKLLYDGWSGRRIGDRHVRLWGSERDLLVGRETSRVRAGRWIRNEVWLNSFRMTAEDLHRYVGRINEFKPTQILSYVMSIFELARFIERERLTVHSPRGIMTSGSVLQPYIRQTVERVFGAPIFNRYGSREVSDMACECEEHAGLHVSAPCHFIEILAPDGRAAAPGEIGEIVVTLLTNYAMPLIRYRIGDLASWAPEPCPCGRGWPLLQDVTGRITSSFVAADGAIVGGGFFGFTLWDKPWIDRFQVVQESVEHVRIVIVPRGGTPPAGHERQLADVVRKTRRVLGASCRVDFDFVDEIAPTPSGKHWYAVSKVTQTLWPDDGQDE